MLLNRWALTEEQKNFGCLRTHRGALPLSELHLDIELAGLDYRLTMRQTFLNVHSESIEAVYTFALASGAAVLHCRMTCEDGVVEAQLRERSMARKNFQGALRGSQQAALVEAERPEVFTMTVGNLPARQLVEIHLELVGPLRCLDNTAVLRFPLVVAPRYIPGQPLLQQDVGQGTSPDTHKTPDASRITPPVLLAGYPNPVIFSLEIHLDGHLWNPEAVRCSLPLEVDGNRLYFVPTQGGIDHDLVLALPFSEELQSSLQLEDSGIFCLTLIPPASSGRDRSPLDVAILVDRSAAMIGWPLEAARRCTTLLLSHLTGGDRFALMSFADSCTPARLKAASDDECGAALEELENLNAAGGSNLAAALRAPIPAETRVIVLTHGRVGNEAEVLSLCAGRNLSTIGLGPAVNAGLLEQMGSFCQLAQNEEQLESALRLLTRSLHPPVLSDLQVQGASQMAPEPGDLYPGLATRIYGRGKPQVEGLDIPVQKRPGNTLAKLWARQRLLQMEQAYQTRRADSPTPAQIVQFSLEHGVLSRFTAMVAVDRESQVPLRAYTLVQAVEPVRVTSHSYSGTIKVDLLPTEKRGFQIDPLKLLLFLAVVAAFLYYLLR